jgi:hypothetical protein
MDPFDFQNWVLAKGQSAFAKIVRMPSLEQARSASIVRSEDELTFPVLGFWMSSILVGCSKFKVTLKFHYSIPALQDWLQNLESRELLLDSDGVRNFGSELVNWWAGGVRSALNATDSNTSVGLPTFSRGFDELFSRKSNGRDCFFAASSIDQAASPEAKLWLSLLVEMKDLEALQEFQLGDDPGERAPVGGFELL